MKDKKVTHLEIQKLRGEVKESTSDEDAFKDKVDEKLRHYALTPFQQLLITQM